MGCLRYLSCSCKHENIMMTSTRASGRNITKTNFLVVREEKFSLLLSFPIIVTITLVGVPRLCVSVPRLCVSDIGG